MTASDEPRDDAPPLEPLPPPVAADDGAGTGAAEPQHEAALSGPSHPDLRDLASATVLIVVANVLVGALLAATRGRLPHGVLGGEPAAVELLASNLIGGGVTVAILAYFGAMKYRRRFTESFEIRPLDHGPLRFMACGAGLAVAFALLPIPSGDSYIAELMESPGGRMALYVIAVTLPFVEELYFRGFAFGILARSAGPVAALVSTTVVFAALHVPQLAGDWWAVPVIFVVGGVLGLLRLRTGSLTPSIVTHTAYNATLVLVAMFAE